MVIIDFNGNFINGIIWIFISVLFFSMNDNMKFNFSGGKDVWLVGDYFNMWVCDIFGGILGYV